MSAAVMPRKKGADPLDLVIAVMAFLAALALGAALIAGRLSETWSSGLSGSMTVQVLPPAGDPTRAAVARETDAAIKVLRAAPGIAAVRPLSEKEEQDLVRPWLGDARIVDSLPLPQLIDAAIVPGGRVDTALLAARLKELAPDAVLDDHSAWIGRLAGLAGAVVWSAWGILFLIATATVAAVSFATRAGLESHREMVEILHQMGAHANFIARIFEGHYFRASLAAAAAGAAVAVVLFLVAGGLEATGVEAVPFLPPLALKPAEFLWMAAIPLTSGVIGFVTARISVLAALRKIY